MQQQMRESMTISQSLVNVKTEKYLEFSTHTEWHKILSISSSFAKWKLVWKLVWICRAQKLKRHYSYCHSYCSITISHLFYRMWQKICVLAQLATSLVTSTKLINAGPCLVLG